MILYSDPVKQTKLEEAIQLGFIIRQIDPDGIIRYILTPRGQMQMHIEKGFTVFSV